ncbi:hypothetical protein GAYE_SCF54G6203 [Galdieria yellowstonensis]|uniref:glutamine synthetase n=1 Tax=Galdieria yellowstonensis TaxID=3028027 RepID=A0AAV9ILK1_9RHOD|nr:hypothetical protein GAYE_SCF54G6203 [Galdieria yellowstonensis]
MSGEALAEKLKNLPLEDQFQAEYVWLDGNFHPRSKGRTLNLRDFGAAPHKAPASAFPEWNYDGSSTGQAEGHFSEVIIKPCAVYRDPFRGGNNVLVLCDTYWPDGTPHPTNTRHHCQKVMEAAKDLEPWFGVEQEYFLMKISDARPLGFPEGGYPAPQGPYYCGAGAECAFGRDIAEAHWRACLYAGIKVSGINGEVAPGQWEFQVGPCVGIEEGDSLWMARYILIRVAEAFNVMVNLEPKPVEGDWNGSGCHTNFSTKPMREDGGYKKYILPVMEKLKAKHKEHIIAYGKGNEKRLTGKHETASIDSFLYGTGNRGASVRIGNQTAKDGKGYFEDRRPAANMDPYIVTMLLVSTCCDIPYTAPGVLQNGEK